MDYTLDSKNHKAQTRRKSARIGGWIKKDYNLSVGREEIEVLSC